MIRLWNPCPAPVRLGLLAIATSSVLLTFVKVATSSSGKSSPVKIAPVTFPETIPLNSWQFVSGQAIDTRGSDVVMSGHRYEYSQPSSVPGLTIEMRDMNTNHGNVPEFIRDYTALLNRGDQDLAIRHNKEVGFYGVFTEKNRAYLSSCINRHGQSTVTLSQFHSNHNTNAFSPERLKVWLLGQEKLRTHRCLWVQMSVSIHKSSPEAAYPALETVWKTWYQWWHPRFPKS